MRPQSLEEIYQHIQQVLAEPGEHGQTRVLLAVQVEVVSVVALLVTQGDIPL
jgi:hypothetical protein